MGDLNALHAKALAIRQNILEELNIQQELEEGNRLLERTNNARKRAREHQKQNKNISTPPVESRRSLRVQGKTPSGEILELKSEPLFSPGGSGGVKAPTDEQIDVDIYSFLDTRPGTTVPVAKSILQYLSTPNNELTTSSSSTSSSSSSSSTSITSSTKSPNRKKSSPSRLSSSSDNNNHGRDPNILTKLKVPSEQYTCKAFYGQSNRIHHIGFHPMKTRPIAIMGSRNGELALWYPDFSNSDLETNTKRNKISSNKDDDDNEEENANNTSSSSNDKNGNKEDKANNTNENEGDDDDNDAENCNVAVFRLHDGVVNNAFVPPTAHHQIITASYGGDIRLLDINKGMSYRIYADGTLPCQLAYDPNENGGPEDHCFFAATREGSIFHMDTRTKPTKFGYIDAHDKKITALSLQYGGRYLLSASGDTTVKIWDARKIANRESNARSTVEPLSVLQHSVTVTGAAFSPSGRYVTSVCNDNKVRLWDSVDLTSKDTSVFNVPADPAVSAIYHNNFTGRWLTAFKISWDPANDNTLLVGNMVRGIDILHVKPGLGSRGHPGLELLSTVMDPDYLTAVPTQTAVHPSLNMMVGGTASGKAYMFA